MHEFSTVDGFVEINECLADMIKYVANEPSVGLFYVQQHTKNAVHNLVSLKNNVDGKSREMTLHTEDLEDSITMVRSMKESGFPIADEMIRDITTSLNIMSTKQPKKGLINSSSSGFQPGRSSSWGRNAVYVQQQDSEGTSGYLSTVFKTAKLKATNFKWPHLDLKDSRQAKGEKLLFANRLAAPSTSSIMPDKEGEELPVLSQIADELHEEDSLVDETSSSHHLISLSGNFDEFRANREAKLEEWLGETSDQNDDHPGGTESQGL